jgi:hypothetical protein
MRESRTRNARFGMDIDRDRSHGMGGEKYTHDPQPRSCTDNAERPGIPIRVFTRYRAGALHISMILEIWIMRKGCNKKTIPAYLQS